jgi:predicted amidophosphoribosyltransferase
MSRVCESCGAKLDQKAKFCPMCGTTAPEEPVSPESEPHEPFHLDPAVAAKTAASVSARAFGYAVSAIFIIMVVVLMRRPRGLFTD